MAIALRTLEERDRLLKSMGNRYAQRGATALAQTHQEQAVSIRNLIRDLKTITEFAEKKSELEAS